MTEFFESPAAPKGPTATFEMAPPGGRLSPPSGVVPGVAPVERVLARTEEAAISLSPMWVYPTGVEFRILVDATDPETDLDPFDSGHRLGSGRGDDPRRQLRFGFQLADGSKVTTFGGGLGGDPESPSPLLLHRSGGSYAGHWSHAYWLWPSPPPGRLEFVLEWAAAEIPLTRVELDADEIAAARSRSEAIFPGKEDRR